MKNGLEGLKLIINDLKLAESQIIKYYIEFKGEANHPIHVSFVWHETSEIGKFCTCHSNRSTAQAFFLQTVYNYLNQKNGKRFI